MPEQTDWFEDLIGSLEDRMLGSLWRILRNADDVEDAQQEALLRIWRARHQIRGHENPTALVLRISTQTALDALRKRKRTPSNANLEKYETVLAHAQPSALSRLQQEEDAARICEALERLPLKQAEALLLRVFEECSYDEIAAAMHCSSQTARSHVSHARASLAQLLQVPAHKEKNDEKRQSR